MPDSKTLKERKKSIHIEQMIREIKLKQIEESIQRAKSVAFNDTDTVILNVRGSKFEVFKKNLNRFPGTRLGQIVNATSIEEQSELCQVRENEFYFDRNPWVMNLIIDYYLTGKLHIKNTYCVYSLKDELNFWKIDEDEIDLCCKLNYFQQITEVEAQIEFERNATKKFKDLEKFGNCCYPKIRRKVWNLFEKPKSSLSAQVNFLT